MKHFVNASWFLAVLGLTASLPSPSPASHRHRHGCGYEAAPCEAAAPQYEERQVTRYRPVTREKEFTETVWKLVPREEKYTYTVMVPVTRQEKRSVTDYERVPKEVEFAYTVMVPHTVQEKRTVTEIVPVNRAVEFRYFEIVPRVVKETVQQTVYQRQLREFEQQVPITRVVRTPYVDECGRCLP